MPERFVAMRLRDLLGLASLSALASLQSARAQETKGQHRENYRRDHHDPADCLHQGGAGSARF